MSILVIVLPAILLVFQGLPVHSRSRKMHGFVELNDAVTNKIKKTMGELADSSNPEAQANFRSLQKAAELPFLQLDEKIMAYNNYQKGYGARKNPELEDADEPPKGVKVEPRSKSFEKKIAKLLKKLGMKDDFADRVWKAILCDPKKLKELKKKLAEISVSKQYDNCDTDYYYDSVYQTMLYEYDDYDYYLCMGMLEYITSLWRN